MIICSAIIKGGTGKTTTVAALAQAARTKKKKVLAIDLDPQANLSIFLGGDYLLFNKVVVQHNITFNITLPSIEAGVSCHS